MPDPKELTPKTLVRTWTGESGTEHAVTLRKLTVAKLEPLWEQLKARAVAADLARIPDENVAPDERERQADLAWSLYRPLENLVRQGVVEGPGAFAVLRSAFETAVKATKDDPLSEDDWNEYLDGRSYRENQRDGAVLSGLFTAADVAYNFRDLADGPIQTFIDGLLASRPDLIDAAATTAKSLVAAAGAAKRPRAADDAEPEVSDPNAPAASPTP